MVIRQRVRAIFTSSELIMRRQAFHTYTIVNRLRMTITFVPLSDDTIFYFYTTSNLHNRTYTIFCQPTKIVDRVTILRDLLRRLKTYLALHNQLCLVH